jgi:hypothetical protein
MTQSAPAEHNLDIDTSTLTRDELAAHNVRVVEAHFHNENPDDIDKAIALYGPNVVWEAPARGQVYSDAEEVRKAYLDLFRTVSFNRLTSLRRFATDRFVFDDQIADLTVIGTGMPNLDFEPGDRISMRLVHCFELENGKIIREIAYEISREHHGPADHDAIPDGAAVTDYPEGPHYGQW